MYCPSNQLRNKGIDVKEASKLSENRGIFEVQNLIFCAMCEREITRLSKIYCDECKNLFLCVRCFANGTEKMKHKKTHNYRVINSLNFPLIDHEWTAHEELLLLDGLYKFGYGNWDDVAGQVITKNKEQCELHYMTTWHKKTTIDDSELLAKRESPEGELKWITPRHTSVAKTGSEPVIKTLVQQKLDFYSTKVEERREQKAASADTFNDVLGYMPLRGDFDVEFDNEAELFLAEMEFTETDEKAEVELKRKIMQIYNTRLEERNKRKRFVIERGLLDLKKQNMLDRTRTKDEKEIYNILKPFARFCSQEEYESLVEGIAQERELRRRIEVLLSYKKLGLNTFEEVENYLLEKRKTSGQYSKDKANKEILLRGGNATKRNSRLSKEISSLKGGDLRDSGQCSLCDKEITLCQNTQLSYSDYLLIKELLIRESATQGLITKDFASKSITNVDKDKIENIFDFLVTNELIVERK